MMHSCPQRAKTCPLSNRSAITAGSGLLSLQAAGQGPWQQLSLRVVLLRLVTEINTVWLELGTMTGQGQWLGLWLTVTGRLQQPECWPAGVSSQFTQWTSSWRYLNSAWGYCSSYFLPLTPELFFLYEICILFLHINAQVCNYFAFYFAYPCIILFYILSCMLCTLHIVLCFGPGHFGITCFK